MQRVLAAILARDGSISRVEETELVHFVTHLLAGLETPLVMAQVKPLIAIGIWAHLPAARREHELAKSSKLQKLWKKHAKTLADLPAVS